MIQITVNGERRELSSPLTLEQYLGVLGIDPERVAIEYNRHILKRLHWGETPLHPGDQVEIVQFVGGG